MQKHQDIYNNIINKCIYLGGFEASAIKNRIEKRLEGIMKIDEEFSEKLQKYIEASDCNWKNYSITDISGAIGTHVGPGAFAVAFFKK